MKLITAPIKKLLENTPIYTHSEKEPVDTPVIVKFFDPTGRFTYYVTESEPIHTFSLKDGDKTDYKLYGFCVSPLGSDCDEMGYIMFDEMVAGVAQKMLPLERDKGWKGSLKDAYDAYNYPTH